MSPGRARHVAPPLFVIVQIHRLLSADEYHGPGISDSCAGFGVLFPGAARPIDRSAAHHRDDADAYVVVS
jgi:hypothetical protein